MSILPTPYFEFMKASSLSLMVLIGFIGPLGDEIAIAIQTLNETLETVDGCLEELSVDSRTRVDSFEALGGSVASFHTGNDG